MATRVGLRQISLTPLNLQTPKTAWLVQELGTYLPQKLSYSQFSAKIFTFSLPWQPGSVWGKCKWHHWIRHHRKPLTWCKNQEHISHRSSIIANFVKIYKFSLPWQPGSVWGKFKWHHWIRCHRKPSTLCKNQEHISNRSPVIANFLLKFLNFRCHGNRGRSGVSASDTLGFAAIENPILGARIRNISPIEAQL